MILNLSNFIHSLLLENETVIIPGFGAFISSYKPAEISGNEIKPPSKEISFTSKIKNNDGLLVEIIARKAKISQANALKRIEKARENMLFELDKGNSVILEKIGSLSYNDKNEIVFIEIDENNLLIDSFGFESISKDEKIPKTVEPATIKENKEESETVAGAAIFENSEKTDTSDKNLEISKEEESKDVSAVESFRLPEFQAAPTVTEEEKEKKKFAWYWYLLIFIPILIGVYFVIMNQTQPQKTNNTSAQEQVQPEQNIKIEALNPNDSIKTDTVSDNNSPVIEEKIPAEVNTSNQSESGKFYLIRGGFEEEENVAEFMQELKTQGVESFVAGKTGRLILVGIEKYDTEAEAKKALNRYFKTQPDWKLWVYQAK